MTDVMAIDLHNEVKEELYNPTVGEFTVEHIKCPEKYKCLENLHTYVYNKTLFRMKRWLI